MKCKCGSADIHIHFAPGSPLHGLQFCAKCNRIQHYTPARATRETTRNALKDLATQLREKEQSK